MAIRWAVAIGNWSNTATWDGGTLPTVDDDVHADGKTVTIDQDVTVASIRTTQRSGGTAGGGFNVSSGNRTITSDVIGGTSTCLNINAAGSTTTLIGNITGSSSAAAAGGVLFTNGSVLNVTGNIIGGGTTNNQGIRWIAGSGVINVIGNVTGSNLSSATSGIISIADGTINLTGNSIGSDIGSINYGVDVRAGIFNLTGISIGGSASSGTLVSISGVANVLNAIGSNNTSAFGVINTAGLNRLIVEKLEFSTIGSPPVSGLCVFKNTVSPTVKITKLNTTQITLIDLDNIPNELPLESNVRQGTVYNSSNKTGTLSVPSPSNVRKDIPTDNTVGTADLTAEDFWAELTSNITTVGSIGKLVKDNLDATVSSRSSTTDVEQAVTDILNNLPEGITPQQVWEYVSRSLTEAPDVPTAQEIADQVWVDEPDRLKNVSTVQITGSQLQAYLDQ